MSISYLGRKCSVLLLSCVLLGGPASTRPFAAAAVSPIDVSRNLDISTVPLSLLAAQTLPNQAVT